MTIKQAFVAKKEAVKGFLGRNVIDDWNDVLRHAWSMRIVFGWTIIASVIFVAPMVSDEAKALVGVWPFAGGLFIACVSFGIARFTKQPGADNVG